MSQKIYFSGVGAPEAWKPMRWIEVSKCVQDFLFWDATPDLAQATWNWNLCTWDTGKTELEPWEEREAVALPRWIGWSS
jgi:hypothetical protein